MFVGCYRDSTGWGQACIDYALALDAAGVDVVMRAVKLNDRQATLPGRVLELEAKSAAGCGAVVQNVLPHQMDYNGRLRNVGLYFTETSDFRPSTWADRLNAMDALVVANGQQVEAARASGVTKPLHVVPVPTDVGRFERGYRPLDQLKPLKDQGRFLFYFVGEMVRRKNLAALLKAFHLEFDPSEQVDLVIKTDKPGLSAGECRKHVEAFCEEIKRGLKLHGGKLEHYKREHVITERLTAEGLMRLHAAGDCFVMPSYGEAWSIPAFDAMAMGKTPIVPAHTGFLAYMRDDCGWLVDWHKEPVFGVTDTFGDLFVGAEEWGAVDVGHLRRCMRQAYEQESVRKEKAANGTVRAYDFSYEAVGPRLKRAVLDDQPSGLAGGARALFQGIGR